jgi:pteridine reductase
MKLKDKVIFITGAAKRVGRHIALNLAAHGANLIIHYHYSAAEAFSLQKQIKKKFRRRVEVVPADLAKLKEVKELGKIAWNFFGRIDVLINNASTFYPTPLGELTEEQWAGLFNVNTRAPYFLSEWIGLKMKKRKKGKIVNIADWAGLRPYKNYLPYCASKAALIAITQGMAKSLAPQVQVNAVLPGPVMWPDALGIKAKQSVIQKTPLAKIGTPEDVANAVRFLIQDGDFMTGSLIHVDGGRHIF